VVLVEVSCLSFRVSSLRIIGLFHPSRLSSRWMRHPWIGRRRIEAGLVGLAGLHSLLHGVVDLQDDAPGAVLAVGGLVLAFLCITCSQFSLDSPQSAHRRLFEALEGAIGFLLTSPTLARQDAPPRFALYSQNVEHTP